MLNRKLDNYELRFVSLQSENIKGDYGQATPFWSASLTVAIMAMPKEDTLTELMILGTELLREGFFGWVVSETAPQSFNSFKIRQPNESPDIPKDAILVFTLSFRVKLPEVLS